MANRIICVQTGGTRGLLKHFQTFRYKNVQTMAYRSRWGQLVLFSYIYKHLGTRMYRQWHVDTIKCNQVQLDTFSYIWVKVCTTKDK